MLTIKLPADWVCQRMKTLPKDDAVFRDAIRGFQRGDFSRLEPLFEQGRDPAGSRPRIIEWYEEGCFDDEPNALAEALTCACFLGRTEVANYLLTRGVDPSTGAGTGLNALHWAANRGAIGGSTIARSVQGSAGDAQHVRRHCPRYGCMGSNQRVQVRPSSDHRRFARCWCASRPGRLSDGKFSDRCPLPASRRIVGC